MSFLINALFGSPPSRSSRVLGNTQDASVYEVNSDGSSHGRSGSILYSKEDSSKALQGVITSTLWAIARTPGFVQAVGRVESKYIEERQLAGVLEAIGSPQVLESPAALSDAVTKAETFLVANHLVSSERMEPLGALRAIVGLCGNAQKVFDDTVVAQYRKTLKCSRAGCPFEEDAGVHREEALWCSKGSPQQSIDIHVRDTTRKRRRMCLACREMTAVERMEMENSPPCFLAKWPVLGTRKTCENLRIPARLAGEAIYKLSVVLAYHDNKLICLFRERDNHYKVEGGHVKKIPTLEWLQVQPSVALFTRQNFGADEDEARWSPTPSRTQGEGRKRLRLQHVRPAGTKAWMGAGKPSLSEIIEVNDDDGITKGGSDFDDGTDRVDVFDASEARSSMDVGNESFVETSGTSRSKASEGIKGSPTKPSRATEEMSFETPASLARHGGQGADKDESRCDASMPPWTTAARRECPSSKLGQQEVASPVGDWSRSPYLPLNGRPAAIDDRSVSDANGTPTVTRSRLNAKGMCSGRSQCDEPSYDGKAGQRAAECEKDDDVQIVVGPRCPRICATTTLLTSDKAWTVSSPPVTGDRASVSNQRSTSSAPIREPIATRGDFSSTTAIRRDCSAASLSAEEDLKACQADVASRDAVSHVVVADSVATAIIDAVNVLSRPTSPSRKPITPSVSSGHPGSQTARDIPAVHDVDDESGKSALFMGPAWKPTPAAETETLKCLTAQETRVDERCEEHHQCERLGSYEEEVGRRTKQTTPRDRISSGKRKGTTERLMDGGEGEWLPPSHKMEGNVLAEPVRRSNRCKSREGNVGSAAEPLMEDLTLVDETRQDAVSDGADDSGISSKLTLSLQDADDVTVRRIRGINLRHDHFDRILDSDGWLTSQIIDVRVKQLQEKFPHNLYFDSSFFGFLCPTTENAGDLVVDYARVQGWTKRSRLPAGKSSLFDMRKLFIPINQGNVHWVLIVVEMDGQLGEGQDRRARNGADAGGVTSDNNVVYFFDSLGRDGTPYVEAVQQYLVSELSSRDKARQNTFTPSPRPPQNAPRQHNSSDCGVLVLHVMEELSSRPVNELRRLSQDQIMYLRNQLYTSFASEN